MQHLNALSLSVCLAYATWKSVSNEVPIKGRCIQPACSAILPRERSLLSKDKQELEVFFATWFHFLRKGEGTVDSDILESCIFHALGQLTRYYAMSGNFSVHSTGMKLFWILVGFEIGHSNYSTRFHDSKNREQYLLHACTDGNTRVNDLDRNEKIWQNALTGQMMKCEVGVNEVKSRRRNYWPELLLGSSIRGQINLLTPRALF